MCGGNSRKRTFILWNVKIHIIGTQWHLLSWTRTELLQNEHCSHNRNRYCDSCSGSEFEWWAGVPNFGWPLSIKTQSEVKNFVSLGRVAAESVFQHQRMKWEFTCHCRSVADMVPFKFVICMKCGDSSVILTVWAISFRRYGYFYEWPKNWWGGLALHLSGSKS